MNDAWRRALWAIGILISFIMMLTFITVFHDGPDTFRSYIQDIIQRLFAPAFMSFLTVCIVGLMYDIIMKSHDRTGLHDTISKAVRVAIYGRDYHSDIDVRGHGRLSNAQIVTKEKLIELVKEDHQDRLRQFDRQNVIEIHEFGDSWRILIHDTFSNGEDLLDFTIGSNAMFRFQAYQFSNYYSNLILERGRHKSSRSKVRIMFLCDDFIWKDDQMKDNEIGIAASLASQELEGAVKRILKRAADVNKAPASLSPCDNCKMLSRHSGGIYQFRMINRNHFRGYEHELDAFQVPFNIYGNTALSKSFVSASKLETVAPIPHLEISFNQDAIAAQREHFNKLWDLAASTIDAFAETMTDWDALGDGKLLTQWARIDVPLEPKK